MIAGTTALIRKQCAAQRAAVVVINKRSAATWHINMPRYSAGQEEIAP
jgi:hypothetical protein